MSVSYNSSGGRPQNKTIWNNVVCSYDSSDELWIQKCVHCGHVKKAKAKQASKWKAHFLNSCKRCPDHVKNELSPHDFSKHDSNTHPPNIYNLEEDDSGTVEIVCVSERKSKKKQKTMMDYSDFCDTERADYITMSIARFISGCGIAMLVVESPFFIQMLTSLNKTYAKKYLPKSSTFLRNWIPKLRESIELKMSNIWNDIGNSYKSMGIDGVKGENKNKVYIVTEMLNGRTKFNDAIEETGESQTKEVITEIWMNKLKMSSQNDPDKVESQFACIVADNTGVNPATGRILEQKWPKLFFNGCRSHCGDLFMEDIAKIPCIKDIVDQAITIVKFVRNHNGIKLLYQEIANEKGGTMLVSFPDTRFAYADVTL